MAGQQNSFVCCFALTSRRVPSNKAAVAKHDHPRETVLWGSFFMSTATRWQTSFNVFGEWMRNEVFWGPSRSCLKRWSQMIIHKQAQVDPSSQITSCFTFFGSPSGTMFPDCPKWSESKSSSDFWHPSPYFFFSAVLSCYIRRHDWWDFCPYRDIAGTSLSSISHAC